MKQPNDVGMAKSCHGNKLERKLNQISFIFVQGQFKEQK